MSNLLLQRLKLNRIFKTPKSNISSYRFFEDMCSGYSLFLCPKEREEHFLSIEPQNSMLANAYVHRGGYASYDLEQVISSVVNTLMINGIAFLQIKAEYVDLLNEEKVKIGEKLFKVDFMEIKGYPKHRKGKVIFYTKDYLGNIKKEKFDAHALIKLDLKDIGYSRSYFRKLLKKLKKLDVIEASDLVLGKVEEYNFSNHVKHNRIRQLKATKDVGWTLGNDELSNSSILYRRIQMEKIHLIFLEYVVRCINRSIDNYLGNDVGDLIAHIRARDYEQLWADYACGDITMHQLSNILYSRQ